MQSVWLEPQGSSEPVEYQMHFGKRLSRLRSMDVCVCPDGCSLPSLKDLEHLLFDGLDVLTLRLHTGVERERVSIVASIRTIERQTAVRREIARGE